jgi:hypothetical protein
MIMMSKKKIPSLISLLLVATSLYGQVPLKVDRFMEISGMNKQYEQLPALMRQGAMLGLQQRPDAPTELKTILERLISKHFTVTMFKESVKSALNKEMTDTEMDVVLRFYETDLSRRVTDLEVKSTSADILNKIRSLNPETIPLKKRKELDRFLVNLNAMENSRDTQVAVVLGMFQVINADLPKEKRISEKQMEAYARKAFKKREEAMRKYITYSLYITYSSLSLKEIKAYNAYLSLPPVKKLYQVVSRAKIRALRKFSVVFGKALIKEVERIKK